MEIFIGIIGLTILFIIIYSIVLLITSQMYEGIFLKICQLIISIVITINILGLLVYDSLQEEKRWNNGICSNCNSYYILFEVERGRYYYKCDKCNEIFVSLYMITPGKY